MRARMRACLRACARVECVSLKAVYVLVGFRLRAFVHVPFGCPSSACFTHVRVSQSQVHQYFYRIFLFAIAYARIRK